jgi:hypothetical protein
MIVMDAYCIKARRRIEVRGGSEIGPDDIGRRYGSSVLPTDFARQTARGFA